MLGWRFNSIDEIENLRDQMEQNYLIMSMILKDAQAGNFEDMATMTNEEWDLYILSLYNDIEFGMLVDNEMYIDEE